MNSRGQLALFMSALALLISLGSNITSYQLTQERVADNSHKISILADVVHRTGVLAKKAEQGRKAACALRADLRERVRSAKRFLKNHPNGVPGIPVSVIRDGIRNQERTIVAFDYSGLDCKRP